MPPGTFSVISISGPGSLGGGVGGSSRMFRSFLRRTRLGGGGGSGRHFFR